MSDESRLADLVFEWESLRKEGQEVSPDKLCRATPELLPRLLEEIQRLSARHECPATVTLQADAAPDTSQLNMRPTATFDRDGLALAEQRPSRPESSAWSVPGFRIQGEIGRGGMGIVLRARDLELDRDVAVKVLRRAAASESDLSLRFVEEAHISGQLQHPGIAAVYRLGKLPDGSPFFAMKLIQGRTLAQLLADRQDPSQDRPRMLKIFEQICQTLAYAHSRLVIHRDLKPANIMVGAFGEVQVMDWGLAKVLPKPVAAYPPQPVPAPEEASAIRTPRGLAAALVAETNDGSVLGTPSYMPPEQALGEIDRLDERCDVFSLGATLCQVLTGRPPYVAEDSAALLRQATLADLAGAFARLDACGADAELISLTKRCLAAQPDERPRDAGVLAADLTAYLESVEARLRQAELDRAKAEVQAREERRRRRLAVALGLALLLLVGLGSAGLLWFRSRQSATERIVSLALGKAEQLHDQAAKMPVPEIVAKPGVDIFDQAAGAVRESESAVTAWNQAQAAAQEAESALATGVAPESLRSRVARVRSEIDQGCERIDNQHHQLVREDQLLRALDAARMQESIISEGQKLSNAASAKGYEEAFAKFGLAVDPAKSSELADRIADERPTIREAVIVALDDWADDATVVGEEVLAGALRSIASATDSDEWRKRLREADDAAVLMNLSADARLRPPEASSIVLLANRLASPKYGRRDEAINLLRWARGRYPDFWIHFQLGYFLQLAQSPTDVEVEEMIGSYRVALALRPRAAGAHYNLGIALKDMNHLDEAIGEYRLAIEIDPNFSIAHNNLGVALGDKSQLDEALAEYRLAIAINPKDAVAHGNLGAALANKNRLDEAIAEYRLAIAINPKDATTHLRLGAAFANKNQWDEAIAEFRQVLEIDPKYSGAHDSLGTALAAKGQWDGAIAEYRLAIEIDPLKAAAHNNLGTALHNGNELNEAIAAYRRAIEIEPKHPTAHHNLGRALCETNKLDEAIAAYGRAIEIEPNNADAYSDLGVALKMATRLDEAIAAFHRAIELDPKSATAHLNLGAALRSAHQLDEAEAEYRLAIQFDPKSANAHVNLANLLREVGKLDEAILESRLAIELDPKHYEAHSNLGTVLASKGQLDGAIAEYRLAIEIDPRNASAHTNLGIALQKRNDLDEAIAEYRLAIEIDPRFANSHFTLGLALRERGEFSQARESLRLASDLLAPGSPLKVRCDERLQEVDRSIALEARLEGLLSGADRPNDRQEYLEFVEVCRLKRQWGAAVELYSQAFAAEPKLAEVVKTGHRYNAACCAALAGDGQVEDAAKLVESARAKLRQRAIDWLRADLEAWRKLIESDNPDDRQRIATALRYWQTDSALAGLRDQKGLEKLPAPERESCQKLWADVATLLDQAAAKP